MTIPRCNEANRRKHCLYVSCNCHRSISSQQLILKFCFRPEIPYTQTRDPCVFASLLLYSCPLPSLTVSASPARIRTPLKALKWREFRCRWALKAATHYLNTHLQAPARKRFYRLLSRVVRFGWASSLACSEVWVDVLRLPHQWM